MGLVLACLVRILHDDWSIRLGENRPDGVLKHLAAILIYDGVYVVLNVHLKLRNYSGAFSTIKQQKEVYKVSYVINYSDKKRT